MSSLEQSTGLDIPMDSVTFLFTDTEGSTQLWEKHPEAMKSDPRVTRPFTRCLDENQQFCVLLLS